MKFSNPQFYKTDIYHSQQITASLNPATGAKLHPHILGESNDTAYASIQYVQGGGAASIDYGGKMYIYTCLTSRGDITCTAINAQPINIQGDTSEINQDSAFGSASFQAYTNTFAKGGAKQLGQTLVYYNPRGTTDIYTQTVEYVANDVAFTTDKDGNLYVALAKSDYTAVEVYVVGVNTPKAWQLLKTLDWAAVQSSRQKGYCPSKVKFDTENLTDLHILSNCAYTMDYNSGVKIFTLDVLNNTVSSIKPTVDVDISPGQDFSGNVGFCPFSDNFVVYSIFTNMVVMISKTPTLSHYTIPLKDFGFTNTLEFHCMSNIGMYGVKTKNSGQAGQYTFTYGLFWGNVGYNSGKFVNQIWSDLDPVQFVDTASFGVD